MTKQITRVSAAIVAFVFPLLMFAAPAALAADAGTKLQYAGWIPFWNKQSGAFDTAVNLDKLREVSPFSYEVNSNGTLRDVLKIDTGIWPGWLSGVRDLNIKIVPTIAWFDGGGIHALLSNAKRRQAHEDIIANLVLQKHFDGIDIDYESKLTKTNPYFSLFIKGLALRLQPKKKILSCTVEARMPLSSIYAVIPDKVDYANNYQTLNRYCDEVRIMAYDQGTIDLKLNATKGNGNLYAPVADTDWAEKIIKVAIKTIKPKKIMLGVPTYGYEYEATWDNGVTTYRRLRSVGFFTAMDLAEAHNISPQRNSAGELSFTYVSSTLIEVSSALRSNVSSTLPANVPSLNSSSSVTRFVSFSDAEAARQKIALAKKYNLRGIAFFKLDGMADPLLWDYMK